MRAIGVVGDHTPAVDDARAVRRERDILNLCLTQQILRLKLRGLAIASGLVFCEHDGYLHGFQDSMLRGDPLHRYPRYNVTSSESAMPEYHSGTVAFLFPDVEGS